MYIFDLDWTLAETRENRKLPPEKVIEKTKIIYLDLNYKKDCIVVSGRDEKQRLKIYEFLGLQWLFPRLILNDLPFPKPPNHEYKRIVFQRLLDEWSTIDGVFDDNPAVGDVCRDLSIPFYLVQP
jgi:hypothetical protein